MFSGDDLVLACSATLQAPDLSDMPRPQSSRVGSSQGCIRRDAGGYILNGSTTAPNAAVAEFAILSGRIEGQPG